MEKDQIADVTLRLFRKHDESLVRDIVHRMVHSAPLPLQLELLREMVKHKESYWAWVDTANPEDLAKAEELLQRK